MHNFTDLLCRTNEELARIDPMVMNLVVAKAIPSLAHIEIDRYCRWADRVAEGASRWLSSVEAEFRKTPEDWDNDIHMFRLGMLSQFLDQALGIAYKESHRELKKVSYTDPNDLFLTGVIDTRRGTCGTIAELHLALGWRLGWPVTLTKSWWHCLLRFDNGQVVWNLETTDTGRGAFSCQTDAYIMQRDDIDPEHVRSGSDLNTLTPRQVLGVFVGSRGRHLWDTMKIQEARKDFELALTLYPQSRVYRHMLRQCDLYDGASITLQTMPFEPRAPGKAADHLFASNSITFGANFSEDATKTNCDTTQGLQLPAQEARGFKAGDANLRRYVGNDSTNAADPTGLAPRTEAGSRAILNKEIARFKGRGWKFAANLLQHFVDKKGPTGYTLTAADKTEVMRESEKLVKSAICEAIWDNKDINCGNLQGSSIRFNEHVRWVPTGLAESALGTGHGAVASERVQDANDAMFYAYAGADLKIEGKIIKATPMMTRPGRVYIQFDVEAKVTISDNYTFAPEGPLGSRLWINEYAAAHYLQEKLKPSPYKRFNNTVTFTKVYRGLRSDQIHGFAFHRDRPIRSR